MSPCQTCGDSEWFICMNCGRPAEEFGPYTVEHLLCRRCVGVSVEEVAREERCCLLQEENEDDGSR